MSETDDLWQRLSRAEKPIWLYGMGDGADKILNELERRNIAVSGVFASDGFVRHQQFRGFTVMSYGEAKDISGDIIVLVCFGTSRADVLGNIYRIAEEQELYAPDVPVVGEGVFDSEYAAAHEAELGQVYGMLADEQSRLVFRECIAYRLSGDIAHLRRCESSPDEAWQNILCPTENEHFIDLGAFVGDTVAEFCAHAGGYGHIYAVEPGEKSFSRLKKATDGMKNVTLINKAVSDKAETLIFNTHGGRNHAVSAKGKPIAADSVDNMLGEKAVTLIKTDVEGSEGAAVDGAKNTILRYKPKMQIACYHRTEDYFALPLKVAEIRDDYRLYMRHFPGVPAWDTNFYFV